MPGPWGPWLRTWPPRTHFPVPNTFARARTLLREAGQDIKECLAAGVIELGLHFFPAIKYRDTWGGKRLWWNCRDFVQIHRAGFTPLPISQVASLTLEVCGEIDRRSLSFSRNLDKYREHGMPWMTKAMSRLPFRMQETPNIRLKVLTFVTCLGMVQNGDYVDFNNLCTLLDDMGQAVSQQLLQKWQIQSRFTLPKVFNMKLWKLHEDIPFRLSKAPLPPGPKRQPREWQDEEVQNEDVQGVDDQDDLRPLERSEARTLPFNSVRVWSVQELSFVNKDKKVKRVEAYEMYIKSCMEARIPARTLRAFICKRHRLMKPSDN